MPTSHETRILDQFTKLASTFGTAPQFTDAQSLDLLLHAARATITDRSLDVACGAGVVACHFARTVQVAEGVDITPAMLEQARARQARENLENVRWTLADVVNLPYADGSFTVVTSRYAFHHMPSPARVLDEMKRVCTPGGRIVVADICLSDDPEAAEFFDDIERLSDPSHVHALTEGEWRTMFERAALPAPEVHRYVLRFSLDRMLRAASRSPEDIAEVEASVRDAVAAGRLPGILAIEGEATQFCYPIAVFAVSKGPA